MLGTNPIHRPPVAAGQEPTVLLIEDNDDHAMLVIRSFEDLGCRCRIVHLSDGEEALAYLFRRSQFADPKDSPRPSLVLLDLRLPRVDGRDVLSQIKSDPEVRDIPVVVLSTSDADRDVRDAYLRNANSYLVKPLDFDLFLALIKGIAEYWLTLNRAPRAAGP